MVFNYPNGNPFKFLFLTRGMVDTLINASIPLQNAFDLPVYHGKLTYGEMAGISKYQDAVCVHLGIPVVNPKPAFGTGFEAASFAEAYDKFESAPFTTHLKTGKQFQTLVIGQTVIFVIGNLTDSSVPGFSIQEANTFSGALLEMIYERVGYHEVHNGMSPYPKLGEFTLAEVLKLLSVENP